MPKLDVSAWQEIPAAINRYTGQSNGPFSELALGSQGKLSQFGVHVERLPPGSRSSFRLWHETEDEFIYVLEGELVLIEDNESMLRAGDAAAWKEGDRVAHCLENRSDRSATFLAVGTRAKSGVVHYPDHNIVMHHDGAGQRFFRSDGSPLEQP